MAYLSFKKAALHIMPPKSIFRQPGAKNFQLVHRSQRDPLIYDPDAGEHVLKEFERKNAKVGSLCNIKSKGFPLPFPREKYSPLMMNQRPMMVVVHLGKQHSTEFISMTVITITLSIYVKLGWRRVAWIVF